jgi:hypothetical protein
MVIVKEDNVNGVREWVTHYHMTEPKRISMVERRALVDNTVGMIRRIQAAFPISEVNYMSMFPRHLTVCCSDHMTEEDMWMMDRTQQEVDREVKDMLVEGEDYVTVLDWWDVIGLDRDMTVEETRALGILDRDGVHLNSRACRCAAVSLCHRYLRDGESWQSKKGSMKRRRLK